MHSYCLPNLFATVFGDCEEVRRVGMAHIRKLYELLHKAEEHMRTKSDAVSTALKVLFKDMHWQNLQISTRVSSSGS